MFCSATRWRVTGKGGGRGLGPQRMILLVSLLLAGCSGPRPAGEPAERARAEESERLAEHRHYRCTHGGDMPELRNWRWMRGSGGTPS